MRWKPEPQGQAANPGRVTRHSMLCHSGRHVRHGRRRPPVLAPGQGVSRPATGCKQWPVSFSRFEYHPHGQKMLNRFWLLSANFWRPASGMGVSPVRFRTAIFISQPKLTGETLCHYRFYYPVPGKTPQNFLPVDRPDCRQVFGLRQPSGAFQRVRGSKAAEGWRTSRLCRVSASPLTLYFLWRSAERLHAIEHLLTAEAALICQGGDENGCEDQIRHRGPPGLPPQLPTPGK